MGSIYERKFTDDEMHRAFKCFDTDNSGTHYSCFSSVTLWNLNLGFITAHELREVFRRLDHQISDQQITTVLRDVDTDRDGKISYDEFVHLLQDV